MNRYDLTNTSWINIKRNFLNISKNEFEELWNLRPNIDNYIKLMGKNIKIPRSQALFGKNDYSFSGITVNPFPLNNKILENMLEKINEIDPNYQYNGIFVNWYQDGTEYIGYHSDSEKDLTIGAPIYSISLGAKRKFKIKDIKTNATMDFMLDDGTLLMMCGDMQKEFKHSIPRTIQCVDRRINLTFRSFKNTNVV
jgi:alkylated DNA repair dioxygenase AlkB